MENEIKGYTLMNPEKLERALHGAVTGNGTQIGGVANADGSFDEDALLAEYDKSGGLIMRGIDRVKTGSFYDFKLRKPRSEPKVVFLYRVNGQEVEIEDGVELPGMVKAARTLAETEKQEAEEVEVPKKKRAKK